MAVYDEMTNDEASEILAEIVDEEGANILRYGDVAAILLEELNNEILDRWAERNPDKAYPDDEDEDDD